MPACGPLRRQRSLSLSRTHPVDFGVQTPPPEVLEVVGGGRILRLTEEDPQPALPAHAHAVRDHRGLDPAPAELAHDTSIAQARDRTHVEEHPGGRPDALDASEVRAEGASVRAPSNQRLDDATEPWAAFAEAGEGDLRVLGRLRGADALHGEAVDRARAGQRATVVAIDVLLGALLRRVAAPLEQPKRGARRCSLRDRDARLAPSNGEPALEPVEHGARRLGHRAEPARAIEDAVGGRLPRPADEPSSVADADSALLRRALVSGEITGDLDALGLLHQRRELGESHRRRL